jgi:hypothetical protein
MEVKLLVCLLALLLAPLTSIAEEIQSKGQRPVSTNEEKELQRIENLSAFLLDQKAVGSSCTTSCSNDPNSGQRSCRTVCDDDSSSGGSTGGGCNTVGSGAVCGCLTGLLIGSLGGGAAAGAGCLVGGALWALSID